MLAVVMCAVALSLAYPVREYIAQRRQIDQLSAQQQALASQLSQLQAEQKQLGSNAYVEQQARDKLHMCMPSQTCYVIINPAAPSSSHASASPAGGSPWYARVWHSVRQADKEPGK